MSTPTRADLYTQIQNVVDLLEEMRKFGRVNSKNVIGMLDTLEQSLEGDYLDELTAAAEAFRSNAAANVSPALAAAMLRPILKQFCKSVITRGDINSDASMLAEMYKYFRENSQRVQSRVFSFGTPAAGGSNVGNGQIIRLNKDQYNFDIENQFVDAKRALCIADFQTGTLRGNEVFQLLGQSPSRDDLQRSGSGAEGTLVGKTADDSLLYNASWTNFSNTASAPTAVTNWTGTDLTGASVTISSSYCTFDSTNYFRAAPSDGSTSYAIKLVASLRLSQKLSVRGTKLLTNQPYLLAIAWNRSPGSAIGTLNIRLGSVTTTVTVAAQSGWQVTTVPNPVGQSCWYRNFAQDDMQVQIEWIRTSGDLLLDDVLLLDGTPFDNSFYWAIPSSGTWTPWRFNDQYTWADSATDSKIQKWIWWAFQAYFPHSNGSSITLSDP